MNLRLPEKQIPSASVPAIYDNALIATYAGKLVHLTATAAGAVLEPATLEDAEAFWQARRPDIPDPVADLSVTALTDFATMRASDAIAFGVKAANLGELHHVLPAAHRVEGFGFPFHYYADFIATAQGGALRHRMLQVDARDRIDYVNTHHNWNDTLAATTDDGHALHWSIEYDFDDGLVQRVWVVGPDGAQVLAPTLVEPRPAQE